MIKLLYKSCAKYARELGLIQVLDYWFIVLAAHGSVFVSRITIVVGYI